MRLASRLLLFAALATSAPLAARDPVTPEQRIGRLERQVRQVQKQVFPKGQPADTAGVDDDPAATKDSVDTLAARLDAVERQMADLVRTSEENTHRLSVMETDLARQRAETDSRFKALEGGAAAAAAPSDATTAPGTDASAPAPQPVADTTPTDSGPPPRPRPKIETGRPVKTTITTTTVSDAPVPPGTPGFDAAGEAAYNAGFDLWTAKKYDEAITQLRAMASSFPGHRKVSWANNLIGRALLDKGEPRAAAEALLANYRGNKAGERAPDSLYYLGQALMKLKQPTQACKAYAELDEVYGTTIRPALKALLPAARAQAKCS